MSEELDTINEVYDKSTGKAKRTVAVADGTKYHIESKTDGTGVHTHTVKDDKGNVVSEAEHDAYDEDGYRDTSTTARITHTKHLPAGHKKELSSLIQQHAQNYARHIDNHGDEIKEQTGTTMNISELFEGQELSEEFKEKAAIIFEAAVALKVQEVEAELTEKFEAELTEKAETIAEDLVEKVDGYLDLMVEQWFEQNQIAIESGMKLEVFENFVSGMKTLFKECYIEVPEEKEDMFAQLEEKVEKLQNELNESVDHRIALKSEIEQLKKEQVISEAIKGLTDLDAEKLKSLAEDVVYESQDTFARKLEVIKESFFANTAPVGDVKAVVTDSPVIEEEVKPSANKTELSESVQQFVKALDLLSVK